MTLAARSMPPRKAVQLWLHAAASAAPPRRARVPGEGWEAFCDGASRGNPGPAAYGVLLADPSGRVVREVGVALGRNTNQVAEYEGLIRALEELRELGVRRARVRTDSQFVVKQFTGEYRAKDARMKELLARARDLARGFEALRVEHVARSSHPHNKRVDRLANEALDKAAGI